MTRAISIHIGLNHVDTSAYPGLEIPELAACINDARAMQDIAAGLDYVTTLLCDEEATADRVIGEIGQAAYNLEPGGILLLTYSGHGAQMEDVNGDEPDGLDETWVLYDRQLIDDELYNLWSQFAPDCRIVVLSDSCHSGSVTRHLEYKSLASSAALAGRYRTKGAAPRFRSISQQAAQADFKRNRARYAALQYAAGGRKRSAEMQASVLLISGCQDNQLSSDGDVNGLFTATVLDVYADGAFSGGYRAFHRAIVAQMPATQTPNYTVIGRPNEALEAQVPFTVAAPGDDTAVAAPAAAGSSVPDIDGPPLVHRDEPPPQFEVSAGRGRYYAVEVATDPSLFQRGAPARTDFNFYGSWRDTAFMQASSYQLPADQWNRLKSEDQLYYRVLTSSLSDDWKDVQVSSGDDDGAAIPMLQVAD